MKKNILIFSIFVFLLPILLSAKIQKDSVLRIIQSNTHDTIKLKALNKLYKEALNIDGKEAMNYAKQYLATAQKLHKNNEIAKGNNFIGMAHFVMGNCDSALPFYLTALKISEETKDSLYAARVMNNIAGCYNYRKAAKESIAYYEKSLEIFRRKKDTLWIGNVSHNIGIQYYNLKAYSKAKEMHTLALECFQHLKDTPSISLALTGLGSTTMHDNISLSKQYYLDALNYVDSAAAPTDIAIIYGNLGEIYLVEKNYPLAEKYVIMALEIEKKQHSLAYLVNNYMRLSDIYDATGDYKKSLENLRFYNAYSDSLFSKDKDARMLDMIKKYETEKKEKEISLLQSQNELKDLQNNQLKWIFGFILVSLIGIVGFIYFLYWQKQKHNQVLSEKNALISQTLSEKEVLMKEIHHRVKNNLQVISSLLNLQSKHIEDELALGAIREGRDRVKSMAMIHQNLYKEDKLTAIEMGAYCQQLAESLFHSYNIHSEKIKLIMNISPIDIDVDNAIPIGLILNELISNSLKYAFPNDKIGKITISLKNNENDIIFEVKDNGIGLPEGWDINKQSSFGYQMINSFAKKLKAKLVIEGKNGTSVALYMPLMRLKKI